MTKSKETFLPHWEPSVHSDDSGRKMLRCLWRHKRVVAGPEERVRQRVLHWLICDKLWPEPHITLEQHLDFADGKGRPDIVLSNRLGNPVMVIEIKRSGKPLDDTDRQQAEAYANKIRSKNIWITNGTDQRFRKRAGNKWKDSEYSEVLGVVGDPPKDIVSNLPKDSNPNAIRGYWGKFREYDESLCDLAYKKHSSTSDFALAIHKIIYNMEFTLPYSYEGLHILEDRRVRPFRAGTPGSKGWFGLYRFLLVATEYRVETAAIGLHRWRSGKRKGYDDVIICVGFAKEKRNHHALQLHSSNCEKIEGGWEMWHNGIMGGRSIPREEVIESIVESGRSDHLLGPRVGAKHVRLGTLPIFTAATWNNTREFLGNLLHYSILRTNLREAKPYSSP